MSGINLCSKHETLTRKKARIQEWESGISIFPGPGLNIKPVAT